MLTEEQLELRRGHIGGSEIAAILGFSPFQTPLDVYISKVDGYRQPSSVDMERGEYLEDGLLRWYAKRKEVELERPGTLVAGLACATPDALALTSTARRVVEAKCPRRAFGWEDGPPEGYQIQAQWTHRVVAATWPVVDPTIHVVALLDGELRVFPLEADAAFQADLISFAESWWERHVVAKNPPPIGGDESARAWLLRRFPRNTNPVRQATPWEDVRMLELKHAEEQETRAIDEAETIRNELRQAIGEASGIESPAGRITWKADRNGKRSFRATWRDQND